MSDTTCTRYGYDSAGRYHVRPVDQCSECRAAPGGGHNPECIQNTAFGDAGNTAWVCYDCGMDMEDAADPRVATWHTGRCDVCGEADVSVTEPRDFAPAVSAIGAGPVFGMPLAEFAKRIGIDMSPPRPNASAFANSRTERERPQTKRRATIPLTTQLKWFEAYAWRAVGLILWRTLTHAPKLIRQARGRGVRGFITYRDSLCFKADVLAELDEELADAVWYGAEHLRRRGLGPS
jgi:hypothetical protein